MKLHLRDFEGQSWENFTLTDDSEISEDENVEGSKLNYFSFHIFSSLISFQTLLLLSLASCVE